MAISSRSCCTVSSSSRIRSCCPWITASSTSTNGVRCSAGMSGSAGSPFAIPHKDSKRGTDQLRLLPGLLRSYEHRFAQAADSLLPCGSFQNRVLFENKLPNLIAYFFLLLPREARQSLAEVVHLFHAFACGIENT